MFVRITQGSLKVPNGSTSFFYTNRLVKLKPTRSRFSPPPVILADLRKTFTVVDLKFRRNWNTYSVNIYHMHLISKCLGICGTIPRLYRNKSTASRPPFFGGKSFESPPFIPLANRLNKVDWGVCISTSPTPWLTHLCSVPLDPNTNLALPAQGVGWGQQQRALGRPNSTEVVSCSTNLEQKCTQL